MDDNKGTGALDVSDAKAAAVQKGERVTIDQLRDQIAAVTYIEGRSADVMGIEGNVEVPLVLQALGCLTICIIVLRNGFTVVGKSACADPSNYNAELGQKLARDDAERQAWAFLGFRLRDRLVGAVGSPASPEQDGERPATKTLGNTDVNGARKNVTDLVVFGDGDTFKLICKASSAREGWMKSTKAMDVPGVGCVVQITTQQRNADGSYVVAEAVTFVPGVQIVEHTKPNSESGAAVIGRSIEKIES